jgi:hypothetical protein
MSETDDRYQNADEKERASDDKDVEGHQAGRAADGETDEADVEGHSMIGQAAPRPAE